MKLMCNKHIALFISEDRPLPGSEHPEESSHHHLKDASPWASPAPSPVPSPKASPQGSPKLQRKKWAFSEKHAFTQENNYESVNAHELVEQLAQSENLQEQADIIHYLYMKKGTDWDTEVDGKYCTVGELLLELYEKVCGLDIFVIYSQSCV
ncbi:uncharacterized protein LOC132714700 [Ruditapes philippinarum]|uniref:uncharacterized protein LOC132714700 n=1 Tax=Ruditapes philippinarum TaxID=129788 RepID=UPI00295A6F84|nr:uncharacterized protein LOC132714700 [Ruditapes philippinarum]